MGKGFNKIWPLRRSRPRCLPLRNLGAWVARALGPPYAISTVHTGDIHRAAEISISVETRDDDTYVEARGPHGSSRPFPITLLGLPPQKPSQGSLGPLRLAT